MFRFCLILILIFITLGQVSVAQTVTSSSVVNISAQVAKNSIPVKDSKGNSISTLNSLLPTLLWFKGSAYPLGTVIVRQLGGAEIILPVLANGSFEGSLSVSAAQSSTIIFIAVTAEGVVTKPRQFTIAIPAGYTTQIVGILLPEKNEENSSTFPIARTEKQDTTYAVQIKKNDCIKDGKLNENDFIYMQYWYKNTSFKSCTDYDGDNMLTLRDFAILAYMWK